MSEKPKIGAGHAGGMFRKGMTELGQYLPAFNSAGTHTVEDAAIWPNRTPGEIAQGRNADVPKAEEEPPQASPEVAAELAKMRGNAQSRGRGR